MDYWYKSAEDSLNELQGSSATGLSEKEVSLRLTKYGENRLVSDKQKSVLQIFFSQFKDFLVIILIVASALSIGLGEVLDGSIIIAIVIINGIIGTFQEKRANNALNALKEMSSPMAKVLRGGEIIKVPSPLIVPGDIVILEAGDYVPADVRLIDSMNLKIDEAALTGESVPVEKFYNKVLDKEAGIGDRINCAFSGTIVTYGRGRAVVTGTGMNTEIGKIAKMLSDVDEEQTPLQKKLDSLGKLLGIMCLGICGLMFIAGIFRGYELLPMFMNAVSLAVAAIPEGLTVIVTVVLAMGMQKMVKSNAIIKRLSAVETLGSTTVICSDKTGTLTQNKMLVVSVTDGLDTWEVSGTGYSAKGKFTCKSGDKPLTEGMKLFMKGSILCNDAEYKPEESTIVGDPTEGALVVLGYKAGYDKPGLNEKHVRVNEVPFDSDRKLMTTFHKDGNRFIAFTKGAPDVVLSRAKFIMRDGDITPITDKDRNAISEANVAYARQALRVLAVSVRYFDAMPDDVTLEEKDLVFLGLSGMIDPPRAEVKDAVAVCKKAGIHAIMITGDHKITAAAIGSQLGMIESESEAIDGKEINALSDKELQGLVRKVSVFARVSPEHKVRLVDAVRASGEIAAMTGDGVNDAPALKRADIGVAMGITGTDVSKEAADMILTDDNFASIVRAVEEGRTIYANIRKVVGYLLSCNIGEILLVFLMTVFLGKMPLMPIHLLSINLITDAFPAFALGMEEKEEGTMDVPPRDPKESIINKSMGVAVTLQSIFLGAAAIASFCFAYFYEFTHLPEDMRLISAQTFCFVTLVVGELLRAYANRSEKKTIFKMKFFGNSFLNKSVLFSLVFLFATVYIPALNGIFKTTPLSFFELDIALGLAIIPVLGAEVSKRIKV